jgi:hypothetical protein
MVDLKQKANKILAKPKATVTRKKTGNNGKETNRKRKKGIQTQYQFSNMDRQITS